ncbi:RNA binding protein [Arthrobacter phage Cassia]|uniref:RNA binding protein n=1 Tax=Arthrobacter phage Cassia TaxID=2927275 RepID=A0AAF0GM59_9CAUD|nr:RNA binding protein [Arthrobacter phage Cassia]
MGQIRTTAAVDTAHALSDAERNGSTVTITIDGHAPETGTVSAHPTLPFGYWRFRPVSGHRAPLSFHSSDVTEVIFE